MREILGEAKTVRQLLSGAKYAVDDYQREYKWETKQVSELLDDLADKFLEDYDDGHERSAVEDYGHYFLGSIIISRKEGRSYIIDGQQRLTTLTLLLMFIQNLQRERGESVNVAELVFSEKFSKRSFNIDVPERTPCMEALFTGTLFDDTHANESVRNILARYEDIEELFPEELRDRALPYFTDWLIENVHLVEIAAYSDEDAYTIFETMNDRGLSLSPTDMLKGYLIANITDEDRRRAANATWKSVIGDLQELGKEEDADAIKAWLRSQHADTIRERKKGARPEDFDRIGTEFHRWIRDQRDNLGLTTVSAVAGFIEQDLAFYGRQYRAARLAAGKLDPTLALECIYYNAEHDFTLQYPLLLAPLRPTDTDAETSRKMRVVARFIDILIARRIWNFRANDYSTMQYAMFNVMREIRGHSAEDVASLLRARLDEQEDFRAMPRFYLHGGNGRQIHRLLARITDHVQRESGQPSRYTEYATRSGKHGYEIEHIWANHPDRHKDEFTDRSDFDQYRNRIGDLLLLPKSFNASYSDLPYDRKVMHYDSQNLLARSLHPNAYEHNPGFNRYRSSHGLPFRPHPEFKRADIDARQELYTRIAEDLWNPARLERELD